MMLAGFLALFALDAFDSGYGFAETVIAFSIHMIPSALILLFLFIAWRRELIGAILFLSLPLIYLYMAGGKFPRNVYFVIDIPMLVISLLFFLNWHYKKRTDK
jgi:hypothetical protein